MNLSRFSSRAGWSSAVWAAWPFVLALVIAVPLVTVAWNSVDVRYEARGNLWLEHPRDDVEPASFDPSLRANAWVELVRSHMVLDAVATKHRLYLRTPYGALRGFAVSEQYVPGAYVLRVGEDGAGYLLATADGAVVERGRLGGAIGEAVGFRWAPPPGAIGPGAGVEFSVLSTRDAGRRLGDDLHASLDRSGSFLTLSLEGADPEEAVTVLGSLMHEVVDVAAELKRRKYVEIRAVLEDQLETVERELAEAEAELYAFRGRSEAARLQKSARLGQEEARLQRRVRTTESLYEEVRLRAERVRLEEASAVPDVRILDVATVSRKPVGDRRLPLSAGILLGLLGTAWAGTMLLDRGWGGAVDVVADGRSGMLPSDGVSLVVIVAGGVFALLVTLALLAL